MTQYTQLRVQVKGEDELNTALKEARKRIGLTQEEAAKLSDVSYRAYQNYEAEERVPNVHAANRIARAVNSTAEKLWGFGAATPEGKGKRI